MRNRIGHADDEILSMQNRAAQLANLLEQIASEDWPRIETGFAQLKTLSRDVRSAAVKRDGLNVRDPNDVADQGNPEALALLRRKLELIAGSLDQSARMISERRAAIAALLA
jgi:hypothetical protein